MPYVSKTISTLTVSVFVQVTHVRSHARHASYIYVSVLYRVARRLRRARFGDRFGHAAAGAR